MTRVDVGNGQWAFKQFWQVCVNYEPRIRSEDLKKPPQIDNLAGKINDLGKHSEYQNIMSEVRCGPLLT